MTRFNSARAAFTTKHGKTEKATGLSNRFSALEVEEPFDYSRLLRLPRELRDHIYDYLAVQEDCLTEEPDKMACAVMKSTVHFRYIKTKMTTWSSTKTKMVYAQGALAMPLFSKQVSAEFKGAIGRMMPHHVHLELTHPTSTGDLVFYDNLPGFWPPATQRVYLDCSHFLPITCQLNDDIAQAPLLAGIETSQLVRHLRACTSMTELVLDWCSEPMSYHPKLPKVDAMHDTLVDIVESLPMLQRYSIRSCGHATFGRRCKGQEWTVVEAAKTPKLDLIVPAGRWAKFLDEMGVTLVVGKPRGRV